MLKSEYIYWQVPKSYLFGTVDRLACHLVSKADGEMGKVRAIFTWLVSRDLNALNEEEEKDIPPECPLDVLLDIKSGKTSPAVLFVQLCRQVITRKVRV